MTISYTELIAVLCIIGVLILISQLVLIGYAKEARKDRTVIAKMIIRLGKLGGFDLTKDL